MEYCIHHSNDQFENVVFSDEVIFYLVGEKPKMWYKDDEDYRIEDENKVNYRKKFHIWGAISRKGKSELYFHDGKVN